MTKNSRLALAVAGFLSLTRSSVAEDSKTLVWILSGQSNACGRAKLIRSD